MNTNRLSKPVEKLLNHQITNEAEASQVFLAFGAWAAHEGFDGIAKFLFKHSEEEREHMMEVVNYIIERGGKVTVGTIDKPHKDPKNLQDCFEQMYKHEVANTEAFYTIVNQAMEERDWATWNFAQTFVKEQIEEETFVMTLLDKLKIAGGAKVTAESLYTLDRDLGNME